MKRGRQSKAERAAIAAMRPADLREPWQITQGKACGCGGQDDMCPCQNENPWPRPFVDWKARAEAAEASTAALVRRVEELEAGLAKRCYVLSEQHLSGYRVILGFETLIDAQAAHDALARTGR
jgi:hypothetical protein